MKYTKLTTIVVNPKVPTTSWANA